MCFDTSPTRRQGAELLDSYRARELIWGRAGVAIKRDILAGSPPRITSKLPICEDFVLAVVYVEGAPRSPARRLESSESAFDEVCSFCAMAVGAEMLIGWGAASVCQSCVREGDQLRENSSA